MIIDQDSVFANESTFIVSSFACIAFALIILLYTSEKVDNFNADNDALNMKAKIAYLEEIIQEQLSVQQSVKLPVKTECKNCLNTYNVIPMVFR